MKICVFGLGYVGCVSIGCLAKAGHQVVGVDVSKTKVDQINSGTPTIIEAGIAELIADSSNAGRIEATEDVTKALDGADASIICVGTPNDATGHLDMTFVGRVAESIGDAIKTRDGYHVVLIRSTVVPGTNRNVSDLITKRSGKSRGSDFDVVSNPEFLREGTAIEDFHNPPVTVIGTDSDLAFDVASRIYESVNAPVWRVAIDTAESIKMINNSWHALKVAFANEVGTICKSLGIDSHEVMNLFCQDDKLNLSPYYLKPGFAYGGSCLPKDLQALNTISHDNHLETPVISAIERSNTAHKDRLVQRILSSKCRRVGILGFSFKPGTDDLRNSPIVEVAETLLGKGYDLKIYDKNVHLSNLAGTNKEYIDAHIPHLSELISGELEDVLSHGEIIIIANREAEFTGLSSRCPDALIIDLVRVEDALQTHPGGYDGIAW